MISNNYGGASVAGVGYGDTINANPAEDVIELMPAGNKITPFRPAVFTFKASGCSVYLRQGSSTAVTNIGKFGLPVVDGIYWRIDVNDETQRFLAIQNIDGVAGEYIINKVSDLLPASSVFI